MNNFFKSFFLLLLLSTSTSGAYGANPDNLYTESKTYILNPDGGATGSSNITDNSHMYYHQNMVPESEDPTIEPNLVYYTPYPYGNHYDMKSFDPAAVAQSQSYNDYNPRERYHHHHHGSGKYSEQPDKSMKNIKKLKKRRRPGNGHHLTESVKSTPRSKAARRQHNSAGSSRRFKSKPRRGGGRRKNKYDGLKKKHRIDRQQDDDDYSREEEDDLRGEEDEEGAGSGIDSLFDFPDVAGNDLDEMEDDLYAGDEDAVQEETFPRPSIIDLDDGLDLAAAGLSGIRNTVMPNLGVSLRGMRRFLRPFLRSRGRFRPGRFFSSASKLLLVFFLLPLVLLFLPIPILSSNTSGTNSRNGFATPAEQMVELGKRVLNSEKCLERISCEINRWSQETGEDPENKLFTKLMKITDKMEPFFPSFMVRMARGYVGMDGNNEVTSNNSSSTSPCLKFECSRIPSL